MAVDLALFREIERASATGSEPRRRQLLQRVTDLFIVGSSDYTDDEIAIFDNVINRLAVDIELSARALLAVRLAPISKAPPKTIRALAFDSSIDVAGPVLAQSDRLDDAALVENASKNGQEHLLAISRRRSLSELVTDVLVERGDHQVVLSTAANGGAKFSEAGFAMLVQRSDGDDRLAACVGSRPEIPLSLFLRLLAKASHSVRVKLEALHPNATGEVRQVVADVTDHIGARALAHSPRSVAAQSMVAALHQSGELNDSTVGAFAKAARFEETSASLAVICDLPVEFVWSAMLRADTETVLILAKASGLSWSTFKSILLLCAGRHFAAGSEVAHCLARFEQLKFATAVDIVRFYRTRAQPGTSQPI
jgi:uncharacterized protein (DUF2336 family)